MKDFLRRRWFLVLLTIGVGVALLRPGWLRPWTHSVPPLAVVSPALFLMAWGLESRSLYQALVRPWAALWAVAISYGLVPALGWGAGQFLADEELRVGLMIVASVPCTLASAVIWTRMGGGREAVALLVVFLSTSTSWLATSAWLAVGTGREVHVDVSHMMSDLVRALVVPVALGQLARLAPPLARVATRHKTLLGVAARLLILVIILRAAVDLGTWLATSGGVGLGLLAACGLCLATHLAALAAGYWSSRLLGFDPPSRVAVAIAGSQKTLPVALFLYDTYYAAMPRAVIPLVCYHVGQLVLDTFIAERLAERPAAAPAGGTPV